MRFAVEDLDREGALSRMIKVIESSVQHHFGKSIDEMEEDYGFTLKVNKGDCDGHPTLLVDFYNEYETDLNFFNALTTKEEKLDYILKQKETGIKRGN